MLHREKKVFKTLLTLSSRISRVRVLSRESSVTRISYHHEAEEQCEGDLHPDTLLDPLGASHFARKPNSCNLHLASTQINKRNLRMIKTADCYHYRN
ncbi:hypothetical protein CDAR_265411 [Caerostris darwini]|uniref:Uncharacterized protein n=1 Tax=Caerostris darwini TaxID=1538125 RepID=A0AAV4PGV0_9ARAC|nr:hypothetical protein CDAR_265411 [Caerostris darwini]